MSDLNIVNDQNPNSEHKTILQMIPRGKMNAVSMRYLSIFLGVDQRTIRSMIAKARIDGNIIAGTDAGLFIPETVSELLEYVRRTQSRIKTSSETLKPAVSFLEGLEDGD